MITIVSTYHPDGTDSPPAHVRHCLKRLDEMGYDYKVEVSRHNNQKITRIAYLNFLDILKKYKKAKEDLLILEDDVLITIRRDELETLARWNNYNGIIRVAWDKKHRHRGHVLVLGAFATYIPRDYIEYLIEQMERSLPQHVDCYFSRNDKINQITLEKSLGLQIQHYSRIIGKIRKGIIL